MTSILLRTIRHLSLALPTTCAACFGLAAQTSAEPIRQPQAPAESALTHAPWQYDEVSAQIPPAQAPTAGAALAQIKIALYRAKQRAQHELCADQWTANGHPLQQHGPTLQPLRNATDNTHYWVYRSLRLPPEMSCGQVSRARFFRVMSRHLPDWITLRPAGQLTGYRQGRTSTAHR